MKKNKIAFDIDNVVLDFTNCFLQTAKKKFNVLNNTKFSDVTRYQFYECLDVSHDKCFEIVNYVLGNPIECNVKPVEGAVEVLTSLSKDIDLIFITARKEKFKESTKKVIYSVLNKVDKNKIIIEHCRGSEKHVILNKLKVNLFVEDRTRNCRILNEKGIETLLLNSPWNQTKESFNRVETWGEISEFIFKNIVKQGSKK